MYAYSKPPPWFLVVKGQIVLYIQEKGALEFFLEKVQPKAPFAVEVCSKNINMDRANYEGTFAEVLVLDSSVKTENLPSCRSVNLKNS